MSDDHLFTLSLGALVLVAVITGRVVTAIIGRYLSPPKCDCLHVDDVAKLLADAGLDKRPSGK